MSTTSTIEVTFRRGRRGDAIAYVGRRVAFPDRKAWGSFPAPQAGEKWEVEIVGENPRRTVYFLRPVRRVPTPAERAIEECLRRPVVSIKKITDEGVSVVFVDGRGHHHKVVVSLWEVDDVCAAITAAINKHMEYAAMEFPYRDACGNLRERSKGYRFLSMEERDVIDKAVALEREAWEEAIARLRGEGVVGELVIDHPDTEPGRVYTLVACSKAHVTGNIRSYMFRADGYDIEAIRSELARLAGEYPSFPFFDVREGYYKYVEREDDSVWGIVSGERAVERGD